MPDRILRSELLTSEAWLSLKSNDDRVCWMVLLLHADNMGNQPAGPHRLVHMWRSFGVDTTEKAAKIMLELADVDLVRPYQAEGKPYCHIPRFRQAMRYLGKLWPISPWTTNEEKQRIASYSRVNHGETQERTGDLQREVEVDVEVEAVPEPKSRSKAAPSVPLETRLAETWTLPDAWHQWAVRYGMAPNKAWEVGSDFRDYWVAKPGKDALKRDWLATWRRWVRGNLHRDTQQRVRA